MTASYCCYLTSLDRHCRGSRPKNPLMISSKFINRLIIFAFMVLVGYSLAQGIRVKSISGIILALISLAAGVYFLYLLAKMKQQQQEETA